jgi:hypothetical protein
MIAILHDLFVVGLISTLGGTVFGIIPTFFDEMHRGDFLLRSPADLQNERKLKWRRRLSHVRDKQLYATAFALILIGTLLMALPELIQ